jgi:hypothetical protein
VAKQVTHGPRHSRFFVPRAEHDMLHAGQHDCAGAHRARFESDVERTIREAPVPTFSRCLTDHQHFGMRGRIFISHGPVRSRSNYLVAANHHCSHRNIPRHGSFISEGQSELHVAFVYRQGVGWRYEVVRQWPAPRD